MMKTKLVNYKITWDELELKGDLKIPESLKPLLQDLHDDLQRNKPNLVGRLQKLIKKYPSNVQLKNYLSSAYMMRGDQDKAMQVNDMILMQHPDYFFAKINKASQYYEEAEYDKIQEILGRDFDLKSLYPDRDVFHISEVMGMQEIAVRYYSAIGDLDQAEKRLEVMRDLDNDALQYIRAMEVFTMATIRAVSKRKEIENRTRITPQNQFHLKKKKFKLPEFNIPATDKLYQYEFDIPDEILQEFFDHDRTQVVEDLENVLKDSFYNYPRHDADEQEEESFAPIHAFFLLGDLESEESLPVVLEMMEQNENYFDEVFGDIFTEAGWIPLLKMAKNQLHVLSDYLKLPGIYTYFKAGASEALAQTWLHFPDKRFEIENIIEDVLDYLSQATPEDNVIDTQFNGLFIWNVTNLKLVQCLPQIQKLYDKGYVSISICGTFEDVKKDITTETKRSFQKDEVMNIKELYNTFDTFQPSSFISDPFEPKIQPVVHTSKKIGRNDPCPCGSGKKYKKCCLSKNIF